MLSTVTSLRARVDSTCGSEAVSMRCCYGWADEGPALKADIVPPLLVQHYPTHPATTHTLPLPNRALHIWGASPVPPPPHPPTHSTYPCASTPPTHPPTDTHLEGQDRAVLPAARHRLGGQQQSRTHTCMPPPSTPTWKGSTLPCSRSYATASASSTTDLTPGLSSPGMRAATSGYLPVLFSLLRL